MTVYAVVVPAAAPLQPGPQTPAAGAAVPGPAPAPAAVQALAAGPGGCTGKDGTCKGRAGADRRCAAHKTST
jgi:hypothetical protein